MNLKKRILLFCAIGAFSLSAHNTHAFSLTDGDMFGNWYFAGTGALGWRTDDYFGPTGREYELGWGVTGSIGTELWRYFRGEFEVGYRRAQLNRTTTQGVGTATPGGHAYELTLMGNFFYDACLGHGFKLYMGAGVGASFWDLSATPTSGDGTAFAWQVMPGLSYDITDHLAFTTGYRFFATTKVKNGGLRSADIPIIHSIEWGIRYSF